MRDSSSIPKDKETKNTKDMCDSCIHKDYCIGAYKKDHWCGNHLSESSGGI